MLAIEEFKIIVKNTPLVAIDLIIENQQGQVLLGRRKNKPALNYFFVPGGRIFKNEKTKDALERISFNEIGVRLTEEDVIFNGIFEHIYDENFFNDESFNTHYLVLSCKAVLTSDNIKLDSQHSELNFYNKDFILKSEEVHIFTKNYFKNTKVENQFL
jgi:colanic acid biosynthesis protein WcaH